MRTVVVTGSAGSGSSTVALGLARGHVQQGRRTVLVRQGAASAEAPEGGEQQPVTRTVDPLAWAGATWDAAAPVRRLLGPPWSTLDGHSLLPVPGLSELSWWGVLRQVWSEGWDTVVVDAGPVAASLPWLTVPDTAVGLLRRTSPLAERGGAAAGTLEAGSWHLRAMAWLDSEAAELLDTLRSGATSVVVVTEPNPHQLGRALQALAPLALFELPVTDIVFNRVHARRSHELAVCDRLRERLPAIGVHSAADRRRPPPPVDLAAELSPGLTLGPRPPRPRVGRTGEQFVWHWRLPFAEREQVAATIAGEDMVLTVGPARRSVPLPSVLRRCHLQGATMSGPVLRLTFLPDPAIWPANKEEP